MHLEDTQWRDLLSSDSWGLNTIPTRFIVDLLEGRVDPTPVREMEARSQYESGYKMHALDRLDPATVNRTLRYSGYDDLVQRLAGNLTDIVYCHSEHGDYFDINYADDVIRKLGLKRNSALIAYFSGSGLCMHVASLGVAIARANGVQAEIVGHPKYYVTGAPSGRHHYGIKLTSETGESQLIIPRGRFAWKFIKNRQFRSISDVLVAGGEAR